MNAEIYLTIIRNDNRLVVSGELALLREFLSAFNTPNTPTVYNPMPDPGNPIPAHMETR